MLVAESLPAECWQWTRCERIGTASREWESLIESPPIKCPVDSVDQCTYDVTWSFAVWGCTQVRIYIGDLIIGEGCGPDHNIDMPLTVRNRRVMPIHGVQTVKIEVRCWGESKDAHAAVERLDITVRRAPLSVE